MPPSLRDASCRHPACAGHEPARALWLTPFAGAHVVIVARPTLALRVLGQRLRIARVGPCELCFAEAQTAATLVIAPDFPLEFARFFPREKSRKTRENSGAFRENPGKKYRIFPSLFSSETAFYPIPTYVFMYEHARPPPPGLYRPAHPPLASAHWQMGPVIIIGDNKGAPGSKPA